MESALNLSILMPILPIGMTSLLFILLLSFNRTINRLTKPISYLALSSILGTSVLAIFCLLNKVEGDFLLKDYWPMLSISNVEIHLRELNEKLIIAVSLIASFIIIYSVLKLPRRNGYVLYIVNIGLLTSLAITSLLLINY